MSKAGSPLMVTSLLLAPLGIDARALRGVIEELPLPFREVLLLADVEEMSYREIAEALSIPVGTVTSRLMRARRKVREAIER